VSSFAAGQTWMWQGRFDPDDTWVLWCVLEAHRGWLLVLTLAAGDFEDRNSTDEPGAVYHISSECIMAETSKRVM